MERDFHFYAIAVLARAAGFKKRDALDIAYASQYVDDSTEGEPIRVGKLLFDPVRTAHCGLKAFDWDVQKKVFIPFHFLPAKPQVREDDTFITAPNSEFAHLLFQRACDEEDKSLRLIAIGVALHTLADTWAHRGCSGRYNKENDVENIRRWDDGQWAHGLFENLCLDFLPQVGHAEAGRCFDCSNLRWKYREERTGSDVERTNTDDFMKAAECICELLAEVSNGEATKRLAWHEIKDGVLACLASDGDADQRAAVWRKTFGHLFKPNDFAYDPTAWRREALKPNDPEDVNWNASSRSQFARMSFPLTKGFWTSRWVRFHKAALKQRHFVLEHLL